jgi:hypothetical protein
MDLFDGSGADMPVEGRFPPLDGATGWLNTEPLTPEALRGRVVAANVCTYTCINWIRTLPYIRGWAARYADQGFVMLGIHTPEFTVEKDVGNIRRALDQMRVEHPIAIDSDYGIWDAFANRYWPALYLIDAEGRIRHHRFGEGDYEGSERVIQRLLSEANGTPPAPDLVSVDPLPPEVEADWAELRTGETYVGHARTEGFASPGGIVPEQPHAYTLPERMGLNGWALGGAWTVQGERARADAPGGRIAFRFHSRDVHLVMGPGAGRAATPFRVTIDGRPPREAAGSDVDAEGIGSFDIPRMYQLIRQRPPIADRRFEIEFPEAGAEAFVFTFG